MNVTKVSTAPVAAKPAATDNAAAPAATDAAHVDAPDGESLADKASNTLAQIGEGLGILLGTRKQAAPPVPHAAGTFSYDAPAAPAGKPGATLSNIPPAALAEVRGRADAALQAVTRALGDSAKAQDTSATKTVDVLATRPTLGPNGPTTESVKVGNATVSNPDKQRADDASVMARVTARGAVRSLNEALAAHPALAGLPRVDPQDLVSTNPMSFARAQPTLENLARQLGAR